MASSTGLGYDDKQSIAKRREIRLGMDEESRRLEQASSSKGFHLWRVDSQQRPCLGTNDSGSGCGMRNQLPPNGFQERVSVILTAIEETGAPLNKGFMWYNQANQRAQAFHIKYAMEPEVYEQHFLGGRDVPRTISDEVFAARFRKDFYGDKVLAVRDAREADKAVRMGKSGLLRAGDDKVLETGAVLLFNTEPLLLKQVTDTVMDSAEKSVVDAFGSAGGNGKPLWHSVCLVPLAGDDSSDARAAEGVKLLIGCKVDEKVFVKHLPRGLQEAFAAAHSYKPPPRKYRGKGPGRGAHGKGKWKKQKSSN
mmetsp:Transcript_3877/g.8776  ORF Transcript_3877/g.8776 Transcript_3877/m.8776 type:complete len:309 (+) Transcript_3877:254-1180(+)